MSNPAAELAKMRPRKDYECLVCGAEFKARQPAKYCSNACKQRAKYRRQKDDR